MMACPPVLTNFTGLVFKPIAPIAITMKNFERTFKLSKITVSTPMLLAIVVMIDAIKKNKELGEDESKKRQDQIQKVTDGYIAKVDEILKVKEADLLEV